MSDGLETGAGCVEGGGVVAGESFKGVAGETFEGFTG
jgi:hypothetical protein